MTFLVSTKLLSQSSDRGRHKIALKLLTKAIEGHFASLSDYRFVENLLGIETIDLVDTKKIKDRLHLHREMSGKTLSEHNLPFEILTDDKESSNPFLDIHIVLNQLRSAFNVGSIIRTTEAQRLGELFFEGITPDATNPKVVKTSMGCSSKVKIQKLNDDTVLHRPIIGFETATNAVSLYDFTFPESFTMVMGNEEYGLSDEWIKKCDHIVSIPMWGFKNSLNVASAFAIAAYEIRRQRHSQKD